MPSTKASTSTDSKIPTAVVKEEVKTPQISSKSTFSRFFSLISRDFTFFTFFSGPQDISSVFDRHRENMETAGTTGLGSSFGLGFRGTIPKLVR